MKDLFNRTAQSDRLPRNVASVSHVRPDWPMSLDEPAENQSFVAGEVSVRGWAIDPLGQLSISARVSDLPWIDVPCGKLRNDVAREYPSDANAKQSGFGARIDVSALKPGEYDFVLQFRRASGALAELHRKIRIVAGSEETRETVAYFHGDCLRLKLEEPLENTPLLRSSLLHVNGWALARTEVEKVEIWVDADGPHPATCGLMREEIATVYDDFPKSSHSGFLWTRRLNEVDPGVHTLRIVLVSKAGNRAEITTRFEIDSRC